MGTVGGCTHDTRATHGAGEMAGEMAGEAAGEAAGMLATCTQHAGWHVVSPAFKRMRTAAARLHPSWARRPS